PTDRVRRSWRLGFPGPARRDEAELWRQVLRISSPDLRQRQLATFPPLDLPRLTLAGWGASSYRRVPSRRGTKQQGTTYRSSEGNLPTVQHRYSLCADRGWCLIG